MFKALRTMSIKNKHYNKCKLSLLYLFKASILNICLSILRSPLYPNNVGMKKGKAYFTLENNTLAL